MKKTFYLLLMGLITFNVSNGQVKRVQAKKVLKLNQQQNVNYLSQQRRPIQIPSKYFLAQIYQTRNKKYANTFDNPSTTVQNLGGINNHVQLIKNPDFTGTQIIANTADNNSSGGCQSGAGNNGEICKLNTVSLDANSTDFLVADYGSGGGATSIYPGAIYNGNPLITGTYQQPAGARNPIMLTASTIGMNANYLPSIIVPDPYKNNILNSLDTGLLKGIPNVNEYTAYSFYKSVNEADLAINASGGGGFCGVTISAGISNTQNDTITTFTIDARKVLYTVSADLDPNGNGYYFSDSSIDGTPDLVMVKSVDYGMRILANVTVTLNSQNDSVGFMVKYSSPSYNANAAFNYISSKSADIQQINGYVVGGSNTGQVSIDPNQVEQQMMSLLNGVTVQNAVPVSYTLEDMAGDVVGEQSSTDNFAFCQCYPGNIPSPTLVSANVQILNNSGKDQSANYWLYLHLGQNQGGPSLAGYDGSHNENIQANTTTSDILTATAPGNNFNASLADFINNNGGSLEIDLHGNFGGFHMNTDWSIQTITLNLGFSDNGTQTIQWVMNNYDLHVDNGHASLVPPLFLLFKSTGAGVFSNVNF